ncbi:SDR family NAD(P)-dependent oxidoreductase [Mycolicibacterium sp.]|uniref:SDR family NAD(P)-dependent oxidoreductase n=1 Tax=Mycolicibacterium sp. TaxID=2320850 RepID=UPI003D12D7C8
METLEGVGCVITGAANGIGYAVARALGLRGGRVVIADLPGAPLDAAVEKLRTEGVEAYGAPCDVRLSDDVERLADFAYKTLQHVDVLFNNAGVGLSGPIASTTLRDWRWVIDVDLWGPIHGVQTFLPRMIEQRRGGHILFTASYAGLAPVAGMGPYCVAKYGVVALAEVLRAEVRQHAIGVSVLCPMRVATNFGQSGRTDGGPQTGEQANAELVAAVPALKKGTSGAGRVLAPDDVAEETVAAILQNRLYVLPHEESRPFIERRFARIDRSFDSA